MDSLYSWNTIGTLAGASAIVFIIVAYTKRIADRYWPKILGTDMYAAFISFIVLLSATAVNGWPITWAKFGLCFFNAFLVAIAAGKMSDKTIKESNRKEGD